MRQERSVERTVQIFTSRCAVAMGLLMATVAKPNVMA